MSPQKPKGSLPQAAWADPRPRLTKRQYRSPISPERELCRHDQLTDRSATATVRAGPARYNVLEMSSKKSWVFPTIMCGVVKSGASSGAIFPSQPAKIEKGPKGPRGADAFEATASKVEGKGRPLLRRCVRGIKLDQVARQRNRPILGAGCSNLRGQAPKLRGRVQGSCRIGAPRRHPAAPTHASKRLLSINSHAVR